MKIALKYGLFAGISIALWDILNYFFLYRTVIGRISFLVDLVLLLVFLLLGMKSIKKQLYHDSITFGSASLSGIQICLVASVSLSLLTWGYYTVSNDKFETYYISENIRVMQEKKIPDIEKQIQELKITFRPFNQAKGAFLVTMLIGAVFSFLFGMVLRNKLPESSLNTFI